MATDINTNPAEATTKYTQPTAVPTAKVKAVGYTGGLVAAIVTILAVFGVIVPDDLSAQAEGAVTALFIVISFAQALAQFIAGYMKKSDTANGAK
jgi:hypothetical protein